MTTRIRTSPYRRLVLLGVALLVIAGLLAVVFFRPKKVVSHHPHGASAQEMMGVSDRILDPGQEHLVVPHPLMPTPTPTPKPLPTPPVLAKPVVLPSGSSAFSVAAGKQIPILMYHYIRDYQDQNDKIGIGLSVSPENLARQLSELKHLGYTSVGFNDVAAGTLPEKPVIITFDDGYDDAFTQALPILQKEGMKAVFYIVSGKLGHNHYMTNEQMVAMHREGMEIASHTVDHQSLATLSPDRQRAELADSKKALETLLGGVPVLDFCYPSGKYNDVTLGLAAELGYRSATTTQPGVATGQEFTGDQYQLPRVRVSNGTSLVGLLK